MIFLKGSWDTYEYHRLLRSVMIYSMASWNAPKHQGILRRFKDTQQHEEISINMIGYTAQWWDTPACFCVPGIASPQVNSPPAQTVNTGLCVQLLSNIMTQEPYPQSQPLPKLYRTSSERKKCPSTGRGRIHYHSCTVSKRPTAPNSQFYITRMFYPAR